MRGSGIDARRAARHEHIVGMWLATLLLLVGRLSPSSKKKKRYVKGRRCTIRDIALPLLMNATEADRYGLSSNSAWRLSGCGHLDLALSPLGEEGAMALAGAMARSSALWRHTLRHVNMSCTAIGKAGADKLLETLKDSQALETLDLSGNWLGDSLVHSNDFMALTVSRRANASLRVLRLRWNGLSEASAAALSQIIAGSGELVELDLGGNWLQNTGLSTIAAAVRGHIALQKLRLDHNGVDARGVRELSNSLMANSTALTVLDLGGNEISDDEHSSGRRQGRGHSKKDSGTGVTSSGLMGRVGSSRGRARALAQVDDTPDSDTLDRSSQGSEAHMQEQMSYWRQVYPRAATSSVAELVASKGVIHDRPNVLVYWTAPRTLTSGQPCLHLRSCLGRGRLDEAGSTAQTSHIGSHFAPIGLPPGSCMQNHFGATTGAPRSKWESAYAYMPGAADNTWSEVAQLQNRSTDMQLYLATGSGVFWNCGTSLRARNKVAAALRLTEQLSSVMSRDLIKGTHAETLAHAIASNDPSLCSSGGHCKALVGSVTKTGSNSPASAQLASALVRVGQGVEPANFIEERLSNSPVFDIILRDWGKRVGYDSIQLAMQLQAACGPTLWWTTELLDLRVGVHATDILPFLEVRDPLALPTESGIPCQVPAEKSSRRAFNMLLFCEGTLMERSARCLADRPMRGRHARATPTSHRIEDCLRVY